MMKKRVVVELDLGIRGDDPSVRGERERVDLDQLCAVPEEQIRRAGNNRRKLFAKSRIEIGCKREFAPDERRVPDRRIDKKLVNRLGMLLGHFLESMPPKRVTINTGFLAVRSTEIAQ